MAEKTQNIPDFEILLPDAQLYPVIFNSPHSGAFYRDDFIAASRLKPLALRQSEDSFVDELFSAMPDLGCPLLKANFPRAYLDVNRAPWELDPKMFSDPLPSYVESKSLRVISGLGTIARNVSESQKIYRKKLPFAAAKSRIERYYFPYHQALGDLLDRTASQFGQALLVDCHSMPSGAMPSGVMPSRVMPSGVMPSGIGRLLKSRPKSPDIILGDRYGVTCNSDFTDRLEDLFTGAGFNTTRNKPYAGGYITQTCGQPAQNRHAIQVEINRGLYMNEKSISKSTDFANLQKTLTDIFTTFLQTAPLFAIRHPLAAE